MNLLPKLLCLLVVPLALDGSLAVARAQARMDLSGVWRFRIDPRDEGVQQKYFLSRLQGSVHLPGSMAENGKGETVSAQTRWTGGIVDRSWFSDDRFARYRVRGNVKVPFWLTPSLVYQGAAWYQRDVLIPEAWRGRRMVLSFERCHWETRLWVDSVDAGMRNSLAVAHEYDLTPFLLPGRHTITVCVDNRIKEIDIGHNAHSITDHTQTNWNGIIGRMELRSLSPVYIESVGLFPDVVSRLLTVVVRMRNTTGGRQEGALSLRAAPPGLDGEAAFRSEETIVSDTLTITTRIPFDTKAPLWDEFHPNLYKVVASWHGKHPSMQDSQSVVTGLRTFSVAGTHFSINGRPVFLRGTLDCVLFPQTGYPSMHEKDWDREFRVMRSHGINHVRFHSWCPPEAAFAAADRLGLYLQIECGAWCTVGDGKPIDRWLYDESERIVERYGNHPSFCMMAHGNEPGGANMVRYLESFVDHWKARDRRRVYTAGAGWPIIASSDYISTMEPRIQRWGMGLKSIINSQAPQTQFDFRDTVGAYDRPVVAHETGQWCAYPDFREIPKYHGVLRAGNYEIFRDDLRSRGMGQLAAEFVRASGRLQVLCYKADIEAALRTPQMAGFQLLGLHDFAGQGTATVGIVNLFSESKGYCTPEEFRTFCAPTVPLARMKKLIFLNNEAFSADLEVTHFGEQPIAGCVPAWTITDAHGTVRDSGTLGRRDIPLGSAIALGSISVKLDGFPAPSQLQFTLRVGTGANSWNFWIYPVHIPPLSVENLLLTQNMNEATESFLQQGGRVLMTLKKGSVREERGGSIALGFSSIFWNTAWTSGQPPHTLGILCDPSHPAFAAFPTADHSDYQWWDAMTHAQTLILDSLKGVQPLIRVIDDWFRNRPLALAFEVRVGKGSLLVCSIDLLTDAEERPEARQLLYSLASYAAGPRFRPVHRVDAASIRALLR